MGWLPIYCEAGSRPIAPPDDALFGAPDIGQDRIRLGDRGGDGEGVDNRLDWSASDDEIGVASSCEDIVGGDVDGSPLESCIQTRNRTTDPDDLLREPLSLERQADGSTQQADSDDTNSLPNHRCVQSHDEDDVERSPGRVVRKGVE